MDGEVIVYNKNGLPDFSLLQTREQTSNSFKIDLLSQKYPATYVVFDCLRYRGENITNEPLDKRMNKLKKVVQETKHLQIIYTTEDGLSLWEKVKSMGLEGVMAKKKASPYYQGKRSNLWLKVKKLETIDCVIRGYTKGEGKREETFGALLLGLYKEGEIVDIGKVGTGWTDRDLISLKEKMDSLKIREEDDRIMIEPKLVCEIEYLEKTQHNDLRAPSFKRLRQDKSPEDCTFDQFE